MQARGARIAVLAALGAAAVVLFVVLSGGDDDGDGSGPDGDGTPVSTEQTEPSAPILEVIRIEDGAPVGGVAELSYRQGERVRLKVVPEAGVEEIHLHGYEIERPIEGGKPVTIAFTADLTGRFEVEAHTDEGELQIAELSVNP